MTPARFYTAPFVCIRRPRDVPPTVFGPPARPRDAWPRPISWEPQKLPEAEEALFSGSFQAIAGEDSPGFAHEPRACRRRLTVFRVSRYHTFLCATAHRSEGVFLGRAAAGVRRGAPRNLGPFRSNVVNGEHA